LTDSDVILKWFERNLLIVILMKQGSENKKKKSFRIDNVRFLLSQVVRRNQFFYIDLFEMILENQTIF